MREILSGERPGETPAGCSTSAVEQKYPSLRSVCGHLGQLGGWKVPLKHHIHGVDLKELSWLESQHLNVECLMDAAEEALDGVMDCLVPNQLVSVIEQASLKHREGGSGSEEEALEQTLGELIPLYSVPWGVTLSKETVQMAPEELGAHALDAVRRSQRLGEVLAAA